MIFGRQIVYRIPTGGIPEMRLLKCLPALSVAVVLAACGPGGADKASSTDVPSAPPASAPVAAPVSPAGQNTDGVVPRTATEPLPQTSTKAAPQPTQTRSDEAPSSSQGNVATDGGKNPQLTVLPTTTQHVHIHSVNNSGITGDLNISDDGTTLTTTGTAKGLKVGHSYWSLWYGNGSQATGAANQQCNSDRTLSLQQMFLGQWVGNRLVAEQAGPTGIRLSQIGTVSIREATPAQTQALVTAIRSGKSTPIAPTLLQLRGCGAV